MSPEETEIVEAGRRYRDAHRAWKLKNDAWKSEHPEEYESWYNGAARGSPHVSLFSLPNWARMVRAANDEEMDANMKLREAAQRLP